MCELIENLNRVKVQYIYSPTRVTEVVPYTINGFKTNIYEPAVLRKKVFVVKV